MSHKRQVFKRQHQQRCPARLAPLSVFFQACVESSLDFLQQRDEEARPEKGLANGI